MLESSKAYRFTGLGIVSGGTGYQSKRRGKRANIRNLVDKDPVIV